MRNELHFHISAPDEAAAAAARARWDSLAKPLGSLGLLEDAIVQIAALTGSASVSLKPRALLVFCADNGVRQRGDRSRRGGALSGAQRCLPDGAAC